MVKVFRFLKGIDVLIFSGGGQLDDYWGGAWAHPFTLLKWTLLARLAGIKVAFFGVGVDSLTSSLSKCFLRWALRLAHFRSYRDERTRHFVRELGWNNDDQVHPDLAYGLSVESFRNSERNAAEYGLVIGVSPISASAWTKKDSPQYEAYLSMLGEFATWLVEEKHRVLLFPSQVTMDQPCLQQLVADIKKRGTPLDRVTVVSGEKLTLEDMLSAVSKTDIVVASRLHGIILSSLLFKPVLALSYSKKVAVQMRDLGLEAYSIDLEHIKLEMVKKVFLQLYSERQAIAGQLASRVHENRSWLEFQYTQRLLPAVALQE